MSDKKLQHSTNGTTVDYYNADVVTANDYYPFGSQMPGRKYSQANSNYRYGFNGKEKSDEVYGDGNVYDYGFRIYNPRLGRFLSVDPLIYSYPYYTPYQFAGNMPIAAIDLDGLEQYVVTYHKNINKKVTKLEVRAVFNNNSKIPLNQHVHKIGSKQDVAKGNVLVFEIERTKDGKENMKIVEERNNPKVTLTDEESKIFKNTKANLEPEDGLEQRLDYGTDKPKKTLYTSKPFNNAQTQTYSSEQGFVPNDEPPKQKIIVEVEIFMRDEESSYTKEMAKDLQWRFKHGSGEAILKEYKADAVILKPKVHYNAKDLSGNDFDKNPSTTSGEIRVTKVYTEPKK